MRRGERQVEEERFAGFSVEGALIDIVHRLSCQRGKHVHGFEIGQVREIDDHRSHARIRAPEERHRVGELRISQPGEDIVASPLQQGANSVELPGSYQKESPTTFAAANKALLANPIAR